MPMRAEAYSSVGGAPSSLAICGHIATPAASSSDDTRDASAMPSRASALRASGTMRAETSPSASSSCASGASSASPISSARSASASTET